MTQKKLIIWLLLLSTEIIFAQGFMEPERWDMKGGKIEQLEKIKLIEVLQLDEETTLKFFSRRSMHYQNQKKIVSQGDSIMTELTEKFNGENKTDYNIGINQLLAIDQKLFKDREMFLRSLEDLLNPEQIAKLLVFEKRFRNEIRKQIIKQGRQKKGRYPTYD